MLPGLRRRREVSVPEVGSEAPEFFLPSAQGGQLRLSMRTVRGPVIVGFYDGDSQEDEAFFKALAGREDEINLAGGSVVAIGVAEPDEARDFVRRTGLKSYVLYDYARVATRAYGLLERPKKRPDHARPATFLVGGDGKVLEAWTDGRPDPADLLAKVSGITGLPKKAEEAEAEKPKKPPKRAAEDQAAGETAPAPPAEAGAEGPKKMTAEERERIKAERRAARAEGRSLKTGQPKPADGEGEAAATPGERPKLSPEEKERRRAERRAEREAAAEGSAEAPTGEAVAPVPPAGGARPKMTAEERERVKAERRAARAEGRSLKTPQPGAEAPADGEPADGKPEEEG